MCLQTDLKGRLAKLQLERLTVMDELCEYLSEIPPADISSFFKPGATFIQKRLAMRYFLLCFNVLVYVPCVLSIYAICKSRDTIWKLPKYTCNFQIALFANCVNIVAQSINDLYRVHYF